MSEDTIRLVTLGRILRRRRRLLAVLVVVGALVGYGTSLLFPPRYTASASVLLPGQWEERELLTQAEIATSSTVVDRAAAALRRPDVSRTELRDDVSAKATDGNIIKISGTADTPARAQRLTDQVARQFVAFAGRIAGDTGDTGATSDTDGAAGPEALRQQVTKTNRRITDLADAADPGQTVESVQARTELEQLRTALQEAMKKLDEADPATSKAGMVVMGPAPRPTGEAPPTRLQLIVGGAVLFLLLAVVGHLVAARANRRPHGEAEIAAALGATPLGTVDVPAGRHGPKRRGVRARLRRLLGTDTRWDVPVPRASGDEAGRRLRHRRVCARLRERLPAPRRLLVVVPEGDETARRAAGELVAEAGGDPLLRVVEVPVSRPMVPDRDTESGALVVTGAGTWTAEELAGLAEACADGGHEVVGVVVAGPVRVRTTRSAGRRQRAAADGAVPDDTAAPALAARGRTTGGAV
ncbi:MULTISPECIES: Wzz/FepE/Etk N-terminal domain-containing protein [unclassified Streptomyces]|uniref:Wzz/FepE/Etk N-terminal domain-containing protein n=1 Tax=unclassified Streptomyces TaxID=2593676 RepID=UPI0004C2470B|nr:MULTISPECIES: Wzz/FepE/Etk N-terminal domain-containing protein [unclassified Streptomyces]